MEVSHRKAVVADRDPDTVELVSTWLAPLGYDVIATSTLEGTLDALRGHKQAVVLAATTLPAFNAEIVCRRLRSELDHVQIVLLLPERIRDAVANAFEAGADDVIEKPFIVAELRTRLRKAARMLTLEAIRANRNSESETLAEIGAWSNIHSRRYLDVQLSHEISRAHRFAHALALVLVEAPSIGGDKRAVRTLGRLLTEHTRNRIDWVADYAEHTLALVLPETTLRGALSLAKRLHEELAGNMPVAAGLPTHLKVNFGVSAMAEARGSVAERIDAQALLRSAEIYLRDGATAAKAFAIAEEPPASRGLE